VVLWRLVAVEQQRPDNVACGQTGVAERYGEGFLGVAWEVDQLDRASTSEHWALPAAPHSPPVFAASQEKMSGLQPNKKAMQ
jgi:hypothetical protein